MISITLNIADKIKYINKQFPYLMVHVHFWNLMIEVVFIVFAIVAMGRQFEDANEEEEQQLIEEDDIQDEDERNGEVGVHNTGKDT